MWIAALVALFLLGLVGLGWSVVKVMQAIDEAFEEKNKAVKEFYSAASDANTAARVAGKPTQTFFKKP